MRGVSSEMDTLFASARAAQHTLGPSLTHRREAGPTPGTVSHVAARTPRQNFRSDSAFSATIAPPSPEMQWSTAINHADRSD